VKAGVSRPIKLGPNDLAKNTLALCFAQGTLAGIGLAAASNIVDKTRGKGVLYVKKKNVVGCAVTPAENGLYLTPCSSTKASGLYIKTGSGIYVSGEGILLGPNSPSNIPFLGI